MFLFPKTQTITSKGTIWPYCAESAIKLQSINLWLYVILIKISHDWHFFIASLYGLSRHLSLPLDKCMSPFLGHSTIWEKSFSLFSAHRTNDGWSSCYEDLDGLFPGQLEETTETSSCNVVRGHIAKDLSPNKVIDVAQNLPLWRLLLTFVLRAACGSCQKR